MSQRNYLEVEPKAGSFFSLLDPELKELEDVISPSFKEFLDPAGSNFKRVTPVEGFCVKAKTDDNEKLFINVCHCSDIPPPPAFVNVREVIAGAKSDEETLLHFPLSLGDLHLEKDKSGSECKCYDVVLNSEYYKDISKDTVLRDFVMTLACSGLERKYDISIDVGTCTVLNKRYHGTMPPHYIQLKPDAKNEFSPIENIIGDSDIMMPVKDPSRLKILPTPVITDAKLYQVPATNTPSLLVFQGLTTAVESKRSLHVLVSDHKLTVRHTNGKILVNIALPYAVIPNKSLSNFWKKRLTVAMFVASSISE